MVIRHWQASDADQLRPLIRGMLEETFADGAQLAPEDTNVGILLAMGLLWSAAGEPTFVADQDGMLLGFCLWGPEPNPLEMVGRPGSLMGVGTFVAKGHRLDGLATRIRSAALLHAKRLGYKRISGVAYSQAGLQSSLAVGFKVTAQVVELAL